MKQYITEDNKIIINSLNDFNIEHILECGQVFRYEKINDNYVVYSKNERAEIKNFKDKVIIECTNVEYFINYFDLETDYSIIKSNLIRNSFFQNNKKINITDVLNKIYGMRILKQDSFEAIISFIISANNNIKRIQLIINRICQKFGKYNAKYNYYEFPTIEELEMATVDDFRLLGAGYRAEYLYKVIRQLKNFDYDFIKNSKTEESVKKLLNLSGVGPKVADCILLYGFYKLDVFPVDTWIKKVYNSYFTDKTSENVVEIRKKLVDNFKELSGYAQQYLFYYKRNFDKDDI